MNTVMKAASQAPVVALSAPITLMDTETCTATVQKLLTDGETTSDNITCHRHIGPSSGFVSIIVPAAHLLALDLEDTTITRVSVVEKGQRYGITFKHYQDALAYLAKHYGLALADDCTTTTADASPCSSAIVVPAQLSTPPRLTRRPLSTTAFNPYGVIHMSKKQPIRVFLEQEIHSRYLIQAGTHGLTPSALAERLIESGLSQLERGDKAPLTPSVGSASPAPHGKEA